MTDNVSRHHVSTWIAFARNFLDINISEHTFWVLFRHDERHIQRFSRIHLKQSARVMRQSNEYDLGPRKPEKMDQRYHLLGSGDHSGEAVDERTEALLNVA